LAVFSGLYFFTCCVPSAYLMFCSRRGCMEDFQVDER
jgi:hypothetical protein